MDCLVVHTSQGPFDLVGRLYTGDRPVLLILGGIWPPKDHNHHFVEMLPRCSVLVAPLPGMGFSGTLDFDLRRFSVLLDEVVAAILPTRPLIPVGFSTGAAATLGMKSPRIARHIVVEPFFHTSPLWPVQQFVRGSILGPSGTAGARMAADQIFGITAQGVEDRDYASGLAELSVPTDAILGGLPLEPARTVAGWPSLVSAEDREQLAAHPLVTVHHASAQSGHYLDAPADIQLIKTVMAAAVDGARAGSAG